MSVTIKGQQYGLGCLPPADRTVVNSIPLYADEKPIFPWSVIRDLAHHDTRLRSRVRFDATQFIGNQGSLSSCAGYAAAKALERAQILRGLPHVRLSGEDLYSQINNGQDRGAQLHDAMRAVENGVAFEALVDQRRWPIRPSQEAVASRKLNKGLRCYRAENEQELASGLVAGYIGVFAVHFSQAWDQLDANGVTRGGSGPGNHAIIIDDVFFQQDKPVYNMANSHSLAFGESGNCLVYWDRHLAEPRRYHSGFLIGGTIDRE